MNKNLLAYAAAYASYIMHNLPEADWKQIREIIIFGSVSRGEATAKSDIDLFFNLFKRSDRVEKAISRLTSKFFDTEIFSRWKLLEVTNEIKPIVGVIEEWKELLPSIAANGILLYGKYFSPQKRKKSVAVLYWKKVAGESKRVQLSKKIFGYQYKGKRYGGLQEKSKALKLSAHCLAIPLDELPIYIEVFKKLKVPYKIMYF